MPTRQKRNPPKTKQTPRPWQARRRCPTGSWSTAGYQYAALNGHNTDTVSVTESGQDTVNVSVTRTAPTFLLSLLGIGSIKVTSTTQATIEALGQVGGHVAPYAVKQSNYNNGQGTTLFVENQPGAYGTVDLPTPDNNTGGSCSGNTNAGTPTNVGNELSDQLPAGPLVIGGCLSVKSGASQPSAQVVNGIPARKQPNEHRPHQPRRRHLPGQPPALRQLQRTTATPDVRTDREHAPRW